MFKTTIVMVASVVALSVSVAVAPPSRASSGRVVDEVPVLAQDPLQQAHRALNARNESDESAHRALLVFALRPPQEYVSDSAGRTDNATLRLDLLAADLGEITSCQVPVNLDARYQRAATDTSTYLAGSAHIDDGGDPNCAGATYTIEVSVMSLGQPFIGRPLQSPPVNASGYSPVEETAGLSVPIWSSSHGFHGTATELVWMYRVTGSHPSGLTAESCSVARAGQGTRPIAFHEVSCEESSAR